MRLCHNYSYFVYTSHKNQTLEFIVKTMIVAALVWWLLHSSLV